MKYLENFKSEYIQGIYDFLEQDADVTDFKRDLLDVAKYKKVALHDLEAQYFEYHDLMKQDLENKIVFIFREDGYLGMFYEVEHIDNIDSYEKLEDGDQVSVKIYAEPCIGYIWSDDTRLYVIQNKHNGRTPTRDGWEKYGISSWCIYNRTNKYIVTEHSDLIKGGILPPKINKLITDRNKIKEFKDTMHFSLIINI